MRPVLLLVAVGLFHVACEKAQEPPPVATVSREQPGELKALLDRADALVLKEQGLPAPPAPVSTPVAEYSVEASAEPGAMVRQVAIGRSAWGGPSTRHSAVPARWSAPKTTIDEMRERAIQMFDYQLRDVRRRQALLVERRRLRVAACTGSTVIRSTNQVYDPRRVNAMFPNTEPLARGGLSVDNASTPTCHLITSQVETESDALARLIDRLDEEARRGAIYPGVMRELYARYQIQH